MATKTITIKPTHRSVKAYYETLKGYAGQDISHETAVRSAFQNLLADVAKLHGWTLIPELSHSAKTGTVRPDGTIRDNSYLPRGYWEAKDTSDDLDAEIRKKIAKGYPTTNILFEDTRTAVLYQDAQEVRRIDLKDADALASLLNEFFAYSEPDIDQFEHAVGEFKERVPQLALGLTEKIGDAHKNNPRFISAFGEFFTLCQSSLNPNISVSAVDEMLVQHLLTERLFRTIFDNEEFTQRNVIAAEVEKVITALVSKTFNRREFLKSLDRFYVAIEEAARGLEDFSEKQHFLNTVYERFFQGYSVKVADTHGIVYTPQPIVDFMCASVAEVLEKEFGKPLGSTDVQILDPCTGTGNFVVNLLRRIPKRDLPRMYREQLFANEVMLLPYYIAALNIEHAFYEITGEYEPFEGLCFVDSLDMAEHAQAEFGFMTQKNTARVERQKAAPITVIIGNPPYNVGQLNENDNNKNRKYAVIERRIHDTYAADSKASNKNALSDAYVKFFRWATDRLEGRDGIVCFVSNNGFIDNLAFDGMRKHLAKDFDLLYLVDLKGNIRKDSMRDGIPLGEKHTVFGLSAMVGVSVAVLVKSERQRKARKLLYADVHFRSTREQKFAFIKAARHAGGIQWQEITPSTGYAWLILEDADQFATFVPMGTKAAKAANEADVEALFKVYSGGVKSSRDNVVYDFDHTALQDRVCQFIEDYNGEVDRWKRTPEKSDVDDFVHYDRISWSRDLKLDLQRGKYATFGKSKIRASLYRPFTKRSLFFDRILNEEVYVFPRIFPTPETQQENLAVCGTGVAAERPFADLITRSVPDLNFFGPGTVPQWYPFYVYDEDGSNRRENITDWALGQFRGKYSKQTATSEMEGQGKRGATGHSAIEKWDIFYYVYGLLHHPGYRTKYAGCLKRELPRIPFAPDFWAFAELGRELAHWHLDYETADPYPLKYEETKDHPLSYRVEDKMRLSKDKTALTVNPSLTLAGIPPETFEYRLGNRSALDWVIDQYQVYTDKHSVITSDPNRADDPEYIVRLVGQVIRVSLETVRIVKALPADFGG